MRRVNQKTSVLVAAGLTFILNVAPSQAEVPNTTDAKFKADVLSSSTPVFIECYATWCAPCQKMAPRVNDLAKEFKGKIKFVRVDIDKNEKMAKRYKVDEMPCFLTFKKGQQVSMLTGVKDIVELEDTCNTLLK